MDRLTKLVYSIAFMMLVAGWGAYYAVTRMQLTQDKLLTLVVIETAPSALSIVSGALAVRKGYRALLATGLVEGPCIALFAYTSWPESLAFLAAATSTNALSNPHTVSTVLEAGARGRTLGAILGSASLGWGLASLVAPLAAQHIGYRGVLLASGAAITTSYILLLARTPPRASRPGGAKASTIWMVIYASALAPLLTALEIGFTLVTSRIAHTMVATYYALTLFAASLVTAAVKPLAGYLTEKLGAPRVFYSAIAAYTLWMLACTKLEGVALAAAYMVPIYPFYEVGYYEHTASKLGERLSAPTQYLSYSISAAIATAIAMLNPSYTTALLASAVLTATSLATLKTVDKLLAKTKNP